MKTFDSLADCFASRPKADCIDECESEGLIHLGSGTSREVFEIPGENRIVKFHRGNPYQNRNEVSAWENAPADLKEVLLPVERYADDYGWLVMPKADSVPGTPPQIREIYDAVRPSEWNCKDKNPENLGRYQGRIVLIDYGAGCGPSGLGKPF